MAYARVRAIAVVDNADCDGRQDAIGFGRDWIAEEPREQEYGFTPDVAYQVGWDYAGRFECLKRMKGIAPCGTWARANMSLSAWQVLSGVWRVSSSAGIRRTRWLQFTDATPGATGEVRSYSVLSPNGVFWLNHMGQAPGETGPASVTITWHGDGHVPKYALHLPAYRETDAEARADLGWDTTQQQLQPALWGKPVGCAQWREIAKVDCGSVPRLGALGDKEVLQIVRVEFVDGQIVVRMTEHDQEWPFFGPWAGADGTAVDGVAMVPGLVSVRVVGHPLLLAHSPVTYPTSTVLRPNGWYRVPLRVGGSAVLQPQVPAYRAVCTKPAGTNITLAPEYGTDPINSRPNVTFTGNGTSRAILYTVQEYRDPGNCAGNARSAPVSSSNRPTFAVMEAEGSVDCEWRGATAKLKVQALPGHTLDDIRPNAKAQVTLSTDDGATYYVMHTGYSVPPEKERTPGPIHVDGTLSLADIIEARLAKKNILWQCSFEGNGEAGGWDIRSAFVYLMHCAGVPDNRLNIAPYVSAAGMGAAQYYMATGTLKGARKYAFSPDASFVSCLDTMVESRIIPSGVTSGKWVPLRWGVDRLGLIFLGRPYEHLTGTHLIGGTGRGYTLPAATGHTVDANTSDETDVIAHFRATRSISDFRNLLHCIVGEGLDAAAAWLVDDVSLSNTAARRFIGDLWTRFEQFPDTDTNSLGAMTLRLWDEIAWWHWLVSWTMDDSPDIWPDDEAICYNLTDTELPDASIVRVTKKDWTAGSNGRYSQTIEACVVEEGPG